MDRPYIPSTYLSVLGSILAPQPSSKKRFTRHDNHTPKTVIKVNKKKRKAVSKAKKRNRK